MNFPWLTGNPFEGQLERAIQRNGQPVQILRAPRKTENGWTSQQAWSVDALIGFQEEDEPIRWEGYGTKNLSNANPCWMLLLPTVRPEETDIALLLAGGYYRITNVNVADVVAGEGQGWLCQIIRE